MEVRKLDEKHYVNSETGFTCRYVRSETEIFHLHYHNYYEIFLIVRNEVSHKTNGEEQLLTVGDLLFIRDFDIHEYLPHKNSSFDFINLSFEAKTLTGLKEYLGDSFDFDRLLTMQNPPIVSLSQRETNRLSQKLSDLNMGTVTEKKIKLKRLLLEVFTGYFREEKQSDVKVPLWLETVCEKMRKQENFMQGTERMFEISGKSREHMARSMKKYYGVTPSDYVTELRLSYAANMLRFSNLSVTDICFECGFTNISWFYAQFKRRFNLSPSRYREKYQYKNA